MKKQYIVLVALGLSGLLVSCYKEKPELSPLPADAVSLRADCPPPVATIQSIKEQISALGADGTLNPVNGNGLIPQLEAIEKLLNQEKTGQAFTHLEHFLRRLDQLTQAGVLSEEQRRQLSVPVQKLGVLLSGQTTFTDPRDGKTYRIVQLADCNIWMADNLSINLPGSRVLFDDPDNEMLFGRLYTFALAKVVCPDGWRLPSLAEWNNIRLIYGPLYSTMIANLMAPAYGGNGSSGLDLVPGGAYVRFPDTPGGGYYDLPAAYWASDDYPDVWGAGWTAFYRWDPPVGYNLGYRESALSCRCILGE